MTGGGASQQMRDVVCVVEHKEIMVSEPQLQAATPQKHRMHNSERKSQVSEDYTLCESHSVVSDSL